MKGRKPVPTALKLVRGNPGKRKVSDDEPKPAGGVPSCPSWLGREAKAEWRRLIASLGPTRMLTEADRAALADTCVAWQLVHDLQDDIDEHGRTVFVLERSFEDGTVLYAKAQMNPAVPALLKAIATHRALCAEFGATPSARSRIHVPEAPNDGKGVERLLS